MRADKSFIARARSYGVVRCMHTHTRTHTHATEVTILSLDGGFIWLESKQESSKAYQRHFTRQSSSMKILGGRNMVNFAL